MHLSLKNIKHFETTDGDLVRIVDTYIDLKGLTVQKFLCRIGRFIQSRYFMLSPEDLKFSHIQEHGTLVVNHSTENIKQKFQLWNSDSLSSQERKTDFWLTDFPPPMLLSPWSFSEADMVAGESETMEGANKPFIFSFSQIRGCDVESPDYSYGRLEDIHVSSQGALQDLIVNIGSFFKPDQRFIDAASIKRFDSSYDMLLISLRGVNPHSLPKLSEHQKVYSGEEEMNDIDSERARKEA